MDEEGDGEEDGEGDEKNDEEHTELGRLALEGNVELGSVGDVVGDGRVDASKVDEFLKLLPLELGGGELELGRMRLSDFRMKRTRGRMRRKGG